MERNWDKILQDYSSGEDVDQYDVANFAAFKKNARKNVEIMKEFFPKLSCAAEAAYSSDPADLSSAASDELSASSSPDQSPTTAEEQIDKDKASFDNTDEKKNTRVNQGE
jgi:hypothetical protein